MHVKYTIKQFKTVIPFFPFPFFLYLIDWFPATSLFPGLAPEEIVSSSIQMKYKEINNKTTVNMS